MKGKVSAGQTKHVKFDLETNAKTKGKVSAGETKQNAMKTDLEKMQGKVNAGQTKRNAVKADLQTKIAAAKKEASKLAKVEYLVELLLWNFCKVVILTQRSSVLIFDQRQQKVENAFLKACID